jgi:hypothetical protein
MASDKITNIAPAAILGALVVLAAVVAALATLHVADIETSRKKLEYQLQRRSERLEIYQKAIDLLTDYGWRNVGGRKYDVVNDFTIPFVRSANILRVHGSPASVAAIDEVQKGFAMSNGAKNDRERDAAEEAISTGLDHLVIAARKDVGRRLKDDELDDVPFQPGAGPRT